MVRALRMTLKYVRGKEGREARDLGGPGLLSIGRRGGLGGGEGV